MVPNAGCREDPALISQVSKVDLPPIEPAALRSRCDDELVLKERLYGQVIGNGLLRETAPAARDDKIDVTFQQRRQRAEVHVIDIEACPWKPLHEQFCDRRQNGRRNRFRAANPNLTGGVLGQELNLLNPLLELIKSRAAALEQDVAVDRRHNAARAAIQQAYAQGGFQVRNHL